MKGLATTSLSPLKEARLLRKLNKRIGLPGHATMRELLSRVAKLVAERDAGQSGPAEDPVSKARKGAVAAATLEDLTLVEQLAAGLRATPCAGALRAHAKRSPVALPEPLDAVRKGAAPVEPDQRPGRVLR